MIERIERRGLAFMDMNFLLKNAKRFQEQMQRLQEELAKETVEAQAGGGMVTVKANGKQEIVSIEIDPEIANSGDKKMLEDLVMAAVNESIRKSQELVKDKMGALTGGIKIPGLF